MEFPLLTEKIWLRLDNLKIAFLYVNTIFKFYFSLLLVYFGVKTGIRTVRLGHIAVLSWWSVLKIQKLFKYESLVWKLCEQYYILRRYLDQINTKLYGREANYNSYWLC